VPEGPVSDRVAVPQPAHRHLSVREQTGHSACGAA